MAVGNQPTTGSINGLLSSVAIQLRQACDTIRTQQTYLAGLGTGGLEGIGFDSGDAASVIAMIDYMGTVSQVYYGTATQGSEFDFDGALSSLWAGQ